MTPDWQTPIALVVVALAAAGLVYAAFAKRRRPGCGGCPSGERKFRLPKPGRR